MRSIIQASRVDTYTRKFIVCVQVLLYAVCWRQKICSCSRGSDLGKLFGTTARGSARQETRIRNIAMYSMYLYVCYCTTTEVPSSKATRTTFFSTVVHQSAPSRARNDSRDLCQSEPAAVVGLWAFVPPDLDTLSA